MPRLARVEQDGNYVQLGDISNLLNGVLFIDQSADLFVLAAPTSHSFEFDINTTNSFTLSTTELGVPDDVSVELGTDDDSVLRHRSTTLAANTALTDVVVGTPVTPALAANSLIISNVTADGDIVLVTQTGANSQAGVFIDGSLSTTNLLGGGTQVVAVTATAIAVANGIVKLTMGTVSTFGTTQPTNAIVFRGGTAAAGAITTACAIMSAGVTLEKIIADGTVSTIQT